jgi:hypothetical protein
MMLLRGSAGPSDSLCCYRESPLRPYFATNGTKTCDMFCDQYPFRTFAEAITDIGVTKVGSMQIPIYNPDPYNPDRGGGLTYAEVAAGLVSLMDLLSPEVLVQLMQPYLTAEDVRNKLLVAYTAKARAAWPSISKSNQSLRATTKRRAETVHA